MAKKKTMIYLTEGQQWQLRLKAEELGESMAAVIRTAVDEYLVRERPQIDYMAIVGIGEAEPDISERIDEVMDEIADREDVHSETETSALADRPDDEAGGSSRRKKQAG